jgi:hypothetical protein
VIRGDLVRRQGALRVDRRRQPRPFVAGAPAPAQEVARQVDGDAHEPGTQRRIEVAGRAFQRTDERLLQEVIGIGRAARHAKQKRPEVAFVRAERRVGRSAHVR